MPFLRNNQIEHWPLMRNLKYQAAHAPREPINRIVSSRYILRNAQAGQRECPVCCPVG